MSVYPFLDKHAFRILLISVALATLLSDCSSDDAPAGQVLATVDGQDITQSQLDTERIYAGQGGGLNDRQLLQRLIERKIWANAAADRGLDHSASFFLQRERAVELILANDLAQNVTGELSQPEDADISAYIAKHPWAFSERVRFHLDQIEIPTASAADAASLLTLHSIDAVATYLKTQGVAYQRKANIADAADLSQSDVAKLNAEGAQRPLLTKNGASILVTTVVGSEKISSTKEEQYALAGRLLRKENATLSLLEFDKSLKQKSEVHYAVGIAPLPRAPI